MLRINKEGSVTAHQTIVQTQCLDGLHGTSQDIIAQFQILIVENIHIVLLS